MSRSASAPAFRRQETRMHVQNPEWQRNVDHGKVTLRRSKPSSIWEKKLPERRHHRKLSWSAVGLAGASPIYPIIRSSSPTREQKCKDRIKVTLEMGNIEQLWQIYIESSAWNQDDDAKWPIPNLEFVKVRKAIEAHLRRKIKQALQADDLELLEAAAHMASNKVQILAFQGNAIFPELDKVYHRINQKQAAITGVTRKSAVPDSAKTEAMEALDLAIEAMDGEELSKAIRQAIEAGVDVTEATQQLKIGSQYFSNEPKAGLFAKNCFLGQKRQAHIVNLGPEMDLNLLQRIHQVCGVTMKYYTNTKDIFKPPQDRESRKGMSVAAALAGKSFGGIPIVQQDPPKHTIWIISGPEPSKLAGDMATVGKLLEFNKAGGGLGIIGSGNRGGNPNPLICDANVLMAALSLERMWAHYDGKKQLNPQPEAGKTGFNKVHPILKNVTKLDEGFSTTSIADSVLKQGFVELQRGSNGKVLTAIREPSTAFSGEAGPIVVHASAVQLLCSKEGVGQEQFISNLFLYACLRAKDMTEDFNFGEQEDPPEEESEDDGEEVAMVTEKEESEDEEW